MGNKTVIRILSEKGLKITPQRTTILEIILNLNNHPTAENIVEHLRIFHPSISLSTVYKNLETFSSRGIIQKVKVTGDKLRFDPVTDWHHHLYCPDSDRIEDFYDCDLNRILYDYLKIKKIPDFKAEEIRLQINGKFTDKKDKN
jgi:Fur family transcriptional regulator, peroxide stress response regulator